MSRKKNPKGRNKKRKGGGGRKGSTFGKNCWLLCTKYLDKARAGYKGFSGKSLGKKKKLGQREQGD